LEEAKAALDSAGGRLRGALALAAQKSA